jgi:hypothetical protein
MTVELGKKGEKVMAVINQTGKMNAGRDIINGNQYNYETVYNIQSDPQKFIDALQNILADIVKIKSGSLNPVQADELDFAEKLINKASDEAKKPKPMLERIKNNLTLAKDTMESLGGGLNAVVALGRTIDGLVQQAANFFGG